MRTKCLRSDIHSIAGTLANPSSSTAAFGAACPLCKAAACHVAVSCYTLQPTITRSFLQVMACPGGCIGGGGQPKTHDPDAVLKRMGAIYAVRCCLDH